MSKSDFSLRSLTWQHYVAVAILAIAAYAPTLKVGFLWDDHVIIEHNPWIRQWSWNALHHDFFSDNTQGQGDDYYRPLQALSHRIDYSLFGLNPVGFHATDLLFHIAAGLLLMQLVVALGFPAMTAFITGCLFVVHPAGIEQFLTASGRTTPLSYAFTLLCLLTALQEATPLMIASSLISYAAALWTKEIAMATPALLICVFLYKDMPLRRYALLLPMAVISVIYLVMRHHVVHVQGQLSGSLILLFAVKVFPRILLHYVCLILWPWNLHSHRLIPHLSHAWPLIDLGWMALIAFFVWKKNKTGLFCIAWLVLTILPTTLAMIPGNFMLDHWSYQANLAVLLPLAMFFTFQLNHYRERWHGWLAMVFFPLLIFWAIWVHVNVELRGTDEKLFRWALRFTTSAPLTSNLGIVLLQSNRPYQAIPYLEDVHQRYPEEINNSLALAYAYARIGQRQRGYAILKELSRLNPSYHLPTATAADLSIPTQDQPPTLDLRTTQPS
jgi:hypothetical protein